MSTPSRTHRARPELAERRAERRERLLASGLELFGTRGYAATSVKAVCDHARLTERYFYESFVDRHDLLVAVYDAVIEHVGAAVAAALLHAPAGDPRARLEAGLGAFVGELTGDRRLARVQMFETVGVSEVLEQRRRTVMDAFAALIAREGLESIPASAAVEERLRLASATMLVGGVHELLVRYLVGDLDETVERIVAHMTDVAIALDVGLRAASNP